MDRLTEAVRRFYEAYPYPSGIPEAAGEIEPQQILNRLPVSQTGDRPLRILEAGCGCGRGLIAMARRHPDLRFEGIDINPVAIGLAAELADQQGLANIRFTTADLLKTDTLQTPRGGYDLIYSFGVLHHLADPLLGLRNLKRILAPRGAIACMVYGRYGREPLQRLLEAIDLAVDPNLPTEQRLTPARRLAAVADRSIFKGTPWEATSAVDEVEFADRCLHVHTLSFDIDSLWSLLDQAGMRFAGWLDPEAWSLAELFQEPETRGILAGLDETTRYKVIERLFHRPRLVFRMTVPDGTS